MPLGCTPLSVPRRDWECDHLIETAEPHVKPSSVVDSVTGEERLDTVRTSHGVFLKRDQDEIVRRIEGR